MLSPLLQPQSSQTEQAQTYITNDFKTCKIAPHTHFKACFPHKIWSVREESQAASAFTGTNFSKDMNSSLSQTYSHLEFTCRGLA